MTATMTDRDGLLLAIRERPGDDLPRLAYADWLEEAGEAARAEFIRVQIQRHRAYPSYRVGLTVDGRTRRLLEREAELLDGNARWGDSMANALGIRGAAYGSWGHSGCTGGIRWAWSRGFVGSVYLPLAPFMAGDWKVCQQLFEAHPITAVTLTDRESHVYHNNGQGELYCWAGPRLADAVVGITQAARLPAELWDIVVTDPRCDRKGNWADFDDPGLAHAALSRAAVAHGRAMHGLPLLEETP